MNCQSHQFKNVPPALLARRWFLQECGVGLGAMALAELIGPASTARAATTTADPLAPKAPHFAPRAKNVIFLFMAGAPSHLELFDNKPELAKFNGTLPPPELLKGYRAAFINPNSKLLGPKFKFAKHGQCGAELTELLPHLATVADDIAIVRSMIDRCLQSRPGPDFDEHRQPDFWPAEHRSLGDLWPGERSPRPAGLRRLFQRLERAQRRQRQLGKRLSADRLSGRAVPLRRRAGALSVEPSRRRRARCSANRSRPSAR